MRVVDVQEAIAAERLTAGILLARPEGILNRVAVYEVPDGFRVCVTSERGV